MTDKLIKEMVVPSERLRLVNDRLAGLATERYQLELGELAGDDVSGERVKTLDEAIGKLSKERDVLKREVDA